MNDTESYCAVCNIVASFKCVACKSVYYCSKGHQKIHWHNGHKTECKCYKIVNNEKLGRYLCATRDIKRGEVILREMPLVYGPKMVSVPLCLGCHRKLTTPVVNYYKCSQCSWPLCGRECEQSPLHIDECYLMGKHKFAVRLDYQCNVDIQAQTDEMIKKHSAYCVILPLRCILLKQNQPSKYKKFDVLQDHLSECRDTPLYQILKANLVTFIQRVLGMWEWSEDEILRVAARLDTNAFEVRYNCKFDQLAESKIRAIYPIASMFSHDCVPNVYHTFDEKLQIIFLAKTHIKKGDIISISYTQLLKSTLSRRSHLYQSKYFYCTCQRCSDPTELCTYFSAIQCTKCKIGKLISTDPLNNNAVWQCVLCLNQVSAKQITLVNEAIEKQIGILNKSSPEPLEKFLWRYRNVLHEKNTFVIQIKYALTQLYGNLNQLNEMALNRRIDLCRDLLQIADILDGGYSVFRGHLLLNLQKALTLQAKQQHLNNKMTPLAVQEQLMESMKLLKECSNLFKFERKMQMDLNKRISILEWEIQTNIKSNK